MHPINKIKWRTAEQQNNKISTLLINTTELKILEGLVSPENITCINLFFHIVQAVVVAVGNDSLTLGFELCEVVDNAAAKEGSTVNESGLVDDDFCALGFDALHDALNGRLTEVVGVGLHRETIYADDAVGGIGGVLVVA